jgi:superfamily II DNA or RNA helicase
MSDNYQELIVGETIESLIENEFLSRAETFSYNVGLTSLIVGANGDYTVKSSEDLYTNQDMLSKLLYSYETHSKGKKTLIFNNGINTSLHVYDTFRAAGYPVEHLDNTNSKKERAAILKWFKETPNAILTSVSILTTGFDEPTVDTIILNRATKSLTLYYQMIGRGSRIIQGKSKFSIIDLGNNLHRFGPWGADLDWQKIFKSPNFFLDNLLNDEDLENNFKYEMPEAIRKEFSNSEKVSFDVKKTYTISVKKGESSKVVLERSIVQHAKICIENSEDVYDALALIKLLGEDIDYRIDRYTKCISRSTYNFVDWLKDDYRKKLRAFLRDNFDTMFEEIHGRPAE